MRAPSAALLSLCLVHLSPLFARSVAGGSRQMCRKLERLKDIFIAVRENLTNEDSISFIDLTRKDVLDMPSDERCDLSKRILKFYLYVAFNQSAAASLVTPTQRSRITNDMMAGMERLTCARVLKKQQFSRKSKKILKNMRRAEKDHKVLRRAFRDMELIETLCVHRGV